MKKSKRLAQLEAFIATKRSPTARTVRCGSEEHALSCVARSGYVKVVVEAHPILKGVMNRRLEIKSREYAPGIKTFGLIDYLHNTHNWSVVHV